MIFKFSLNIFLNFQRFSRFVREIFKNLLWQKQFSENIKFFVKVLTGAQNLIRLNFQDFQDFLDFEFLNFWKN